MTQPAYTLAIDIGGTFTDIVLLNQTRQVLAVNKVLTSYPDPSEAVLQGVNHLLTDENVAPDTVTRIIHGTTLVTNTLIERKGAKTALLTTEGFRDALQIGREGRYDIYDLGLIKPEPLVERRLRLGVPGRMDAQGNELKPLDTAYIQAACDTLKADNVEAVGITFLHAYTNPAHERLAADLVKANLPDVSISLSHEVAPAVREYQRTSTTVANAYVQPLTERYLRGLERGLANVGLSAPLQIMLSNGGICSVDTAAQFPIRLVESGPSGGALAGKYWVKEAGFDEVFAFDMGGTTAKAILSENGDFPVTTESEVAHVHRFKGGSGLPLMVPMLHMIEIGAGGGSIAQLNDLGLPKVGPESASSNPGPACYGLGGTEPTVTDADLMLGYLNPDYFVGGEMKLDNAKSREALTSLAKTLDLSAERMAWGIHQLVNENMAGAARVHAAERGLDIRNYTMVATGGAGPVHAVGVAQRLGLKTVIVPPVAGVGSAFGMLLAPVSFDFTRSYIRQFDQIDLNDLNRIMAELESEGRRIVVDAGVPEAEITISREVDMRYVGQGYEIRVTFSGEAVTTDTLAEIQETFNTAYIRFYGRLCEGVPTQVVNWRVIVSGPQPELAKVSLDKGEADSSSPSQKGMRSAIFTADSRAITVPVYDRYVLPSDFQADGPLIIEEAESTTIVPPDWSVMVDSSASLVLTTRRE